MKPRTIELEYCEIDLQHSHECTLTMFYALLEKLSELRNETVLRVYIEENEQYSGVKKLVIELA